MAARADTSGIDARKAPATALVMQGGMALGAYQAGAYAALRRNGRDVDLVAGSSIGAVNAAIIASAPPEERVERLGAFWKSLVSDRWPRAVPPQAEQLSSLVRARLLGWSTFFHPLLRTAMPPGTETPARVGLYDPSPLYVRLQEVVDFERLNDGPVRLLVQAVDVESGQQVIFDSMHGRIDIEHLIASCAYMPEFPPVRIDGRWYCDGALGSNLPLEPALAALGERPVLAVAVDLFDGMGQVPHSLFEALDRFQDLIHAHQSQQTVGAVRTAQALRARLRLLAERLPEELRRDHAVEELLRGDGPTVLSLLHLRYHNKRELPMKAFDASRTSIEARWRAGERDMEEALRRLDAQAPGEDRGFIFHEVHSRD